MLRRRMAAVTLSPGSEAQRAPRQSGRATPYLPVDADPDTPVHQILVGRPPPADLLVNLCHPACVTVNERVCAGEW